MVNVFRDGSSHRIGAEQLMRCITLAADDELRNQGANIMFMCRELLGNMVEFINSEIFHAEKNYLVDDKNGFLDISVDED